MVDQGEEDLDEDEMYMKRLAGGLFSLQLVSSKYLINKTGLEPVS